MFYQTPTHILKSSHNNMLRGPQIIIDSQSPNLKFICHLFFLGNVLYTTFSEVQMPLHLLLHPHLELISLFISLNLN